VQTSNLFGSLLSETEDTVSRTRSRLGLLNNPLSYVHAAKRPLF